MSDYGDDDYSDTGEDWLYVEEEYMPADDLAEHAVQSPPPTFMDEELLPEFDLFEYFNDLEYASDGFDNAKFAPHKNGKGAVKTGQKRKQGATSSRGRKKQKLGNARAKMRVDSPMNIHSPVVWRSQADRGVKLPLLAEDNAESYALLKDWREKLHNVPQWAKASPRPMSPGSSSTEKGKGKGKDAVVPVPISPAAEHDIGKEEAPMEDEDSGIDPDALMKVLQDRLASAGGPLSGMDPQQLLQFAMRMATDKDAGDDIAGEMADEMLKQGDEEEEGDDEAEANLMSWVAQQRDANKGLATNGDSSGLVSTPDTPDGSRRSKRLPKPPSSEATRSSRTQDKVAAPKAQDSTTSQENSNVNAGRASRKRKVDDVPDAETSTTATKRRTTRSYQAPTAASQAKAGPSAKTTRSGRVRR